MTHVLTERDELEAQYCVDFAEHPPTDEAAFRRLFRRWAGRVNIENLLVVAGMEGWSQDLAAEELARLGRGLADEGRFGSDGSDITLR